VNSAGRHTTKAVPVSFHEMVSSVLGSSTIAYVFVRNGGVPAAGDAIERSRCWLGGAGVLSEEEDAAQLFPRQRNASRKVGLGTGLGWR
jgi:hypothetical protein